MFRCTNANVGTYGHECGKPAAWSGTHRSGHVQRFCGRCKVDGDEARQVVTWSPIAATEPTPAGLQYVVPGCEKDRTRGPAQMDLF